MVDVLENAKHNSLLLLNFLSTQGREINPSVVARVLAVARGAEAPKPEEEVQFWSAYRELAQLALPVTVESIVATDEKVGGSGAGRRRVAKVLWPSTLGEQATYFYRAMAVFVLVVVILVQVVWVTGVAITEDVGKLEGKKEELDKRRDEVSAAIRREAPGHNRQGEEQSLGSGPVPETTIWEQERDTRLNEIGYEIIVIGQRLESAYASLASWNRRWEWAMFFIKPPFDQVSPQARSIRPTPGVSKKGELEDQQPETAGEHTIGEGYAGSGVSGETGTARDGGRYAESAKHLELSAATLFLEALSNYALPLLLGLLGACAYILRRLEKELKNHTFSRKSATGYSLRLALGPLAGVAVGLLVGPWSHETVPGPAEIPSLADLSPLALAFVAGYGVELVFLLMDRIIGGFNRQSSVE